LRIEFTRFAEADLIDIHQWIARDDLRTADRILSRIRQATVVLGQFPFLGHEGSVSGTREWAVKGLPYFVVYRVIDHEAVIILNIIHARRDYPPF
jgi:toxin ParE1/3/4